MMESILVAGLLAAVAGGLGALLAHLISGVLNLGKRGQQALTVFFIIVAIAGSRFLLPIFIDPGREASSDAQVAAALEELPAFQMLREYYPDDYDLVAATLSAGLRDSRSSQIDLQNQIRPQIHAVVHRQMPFADDQISGEYLRLVKDQMALLQERSPEGCVAMANGSTYDFDPVQVFGNDILMREQRLMAELLEQSARAPVQPPPPSFFESRAEALAASGLGNLSVADTQALSPFLETGTLPTDRPGSAAYCRFMNGFLDAVLVLPANEQGMIFRGMAAIP